MGKICIGICDDQFEIVNKLDGLVRDISDRKIQRGFLYRCTAIYYKAFFVR
ncbi:hypothetical protein [Butyrivibrio sp. XB500-5]|uniref:hypothetical protein n=1 Tax=Butyrivibrio sp. XB500-5 TaxID=2364880 RepID=UPI001314FB27|nr:hypothetical protein [Butyrivibrio sp. XB500-5]